MRKYIFPILVPRHPSVLRSISRERRPSQKEQSPSLSPSLSSPHLLSHSSFHRNFLSKRFRFLPTVFVSDNGTYAAIVYRLSVSRRDKRRRDGMGSRKGGRNRSALRITESDAENSAGTSKRRSSRMRFLLLRRLILLPDQSGFFPLPSRVNFP